MSDSNSADDMRLTISTAAHIEGREVLLGLTFAPDGSVVPGVRIVPPVARWYEASRVVHTAMHEGGTAGLTQRCEVLAQRAGLSADACDVVREIAGIVEGAAAAHADIARTAYRAYADRTHGDAVL